MIKFQFFVHLPVDHLAQPVVIIIIIIITIIIIIIIIVLYTNTN